MLTATNLYRHHTTPNFSPKKLQFLYRKMHTPFFWKKRYLYDHGKRFCSVYIEYSRDNWCISLLVAISKLVRYSKPFLRYIVYEKCVNTVWLHLFTKKWSVHFFKHRWVIWPCKTVSIPCTGNAVIYRVLWPRTLLPLHCAYSTALYCCISLM